MQRSELVKNGKETMSKCMHSFSLKTSGLSKLMGNSGVNAIQLWHDKD